MHCGGPQAHERLVRKYGGILHPDERLPEAAEACRQGVLNPDLSRLQVRESDLPQCHAVHAAPA
jgi:hypothetical protein